MADSLPAPAIVKAADDMAAALRKLLEHVGCGQYRNSAGLTPTASPQYETALALLAAFTTARQETPDRQAGVSAEGATLAAPSRADLAKIIVEEVMSYFDPRIDGIKLHESEARYIAGGIVRRAIPCG